MNTQEQPHQETMHAFMEQARQQCLTFQRSLKERSETIGIHQKDDINNIISGNAENPHSQKLRLLREGLDKKRKEMLSIISLPIQDHALSLKTNKGRMLTPL